MSEHRRKRVIQIHVQSQRLTAIWPQMSQVERNYVVAMHQQWVGEFRRIGAAEPDNREGIAAGEHRVIDQHVAELFETDRVRAAWVPCKRGCSACCHQNVTITEPEAMLLLKLAEAEGIPIDWDLVERQAEVEPNAEGWDSLPEADRTCVFLGANGDCQVYEHRPSACRKYFVLSNPKDCVGAQQVLFFQSIPAEVVSSASLIAFDNASLPRMLLKALKNVPRALMDQAVTA